MAKSDHKLQAKIRTAVFPVGGFGTRFLPITKSMPKEMLPVFNKPLIQYALEEARDAGIERFIFVVGRNKNLIINYFDHSYEVENLLSTSNKSILSQCVDWLPEPGSIAFVRQRSAMGLGHAIWCAREYIQEEYFCVLLPDEFFIKHTGILPTSHLASEFLKYQSSFVAINNVHPNMVNNYGIVSHSNDKISSMIEKPAIGSVKSTSAIVGRYILHIDIMKYISELINNQCDGKEIQITTAMQHMLRDRYEFRSVLTRSKRYDCGSPTGLLQANITMALHNDPLCKEEIKYVINPGLENNE